MMTSPLTESGKTEAICETPITNQASMLEHPGRLETSMLLRTRPHQYLDRTPKQQFPRVIGIAVEILTMHARLAPQHAATKAALTVTVSQQTTAPNNTEV